MWRPDEAVLWRQVDEAANVPSRAARWPHDAGSSADALRQVRWHAPGVWIGRGDVGSLKEKTTPFVLRGVDVVELRQGVGPWEVRKAGAPLATDRATPYNRSPDWLTQVTMQR